MSELFFNIAMVFVFVIIGGIFAASEMALVSLREGQLRRMERESKAGRKVAALARDSGTFLSAVQIGVTFAGFFSSAFGASTIAPQLVPYLEDLGLSSTAASTVALVILTLAVSYLSLVLGELVPKRLALARNESASKILGPPLSRFAVLLKPIIWVIDMSSRGVLRLIGVNPDEDASAMSDEEVRDIVVSHEGFDVTERDMVEDVFQASNTLLREVMKHRRDVTAIRDDSTLADAVAVVRDHPYSRYPVYHDEIDDVVGFIHIRDLYEAWHESPQASIDAIVRDILMVPGTSTIMPVMNQMRSSGHHIAVVIDEYGGTDGLVTLEDIIEELVGEIWDEYDTEQHREEMKLHESKMFDGQTSLEDFEDRSGIALPDGPYETIAGWMLSHMGRLAESGDIVPISHEFTADEEDDSVYVRYQLEVVNVENNRITAIQLRKTTVPSESGDSAEGNLS
ncbi:hemolysin family protein [Flaviflexus equikiangi]|uniref:HlyC/CorC family transporter n=1 Tax=Flaviflexus equikiangi TaxID=2758573 RepID=A0ABS2TDH3_9ACTO|nr:hemolysin family protein [Flaviflexus equikiangi]MBM9432715.1 HlyC/CorC family transporter [Flaviflexus equikiangi]